MERLTIVIDGVARVTETKFESKEAMQKAVDKLAELEDKLESGQLVELPCKVGDIVYAIMYVDYKYQIVMFRVSNIEIGEFGTFYFHTPTSYSHRLTFGKSVFADKSQAEARLKELQEKL